MMQSNLWMLTGWLAHSSFFLFWQSGWWCTACQGSGYSECRYWQHQVPPIQFSRHPRTLTLAHRCRFWRPASSKQVSVWSLWSHLLEGLWEHQDLRGQGHYIKGLFHKKWQFCHHFVPNLHEFLPLNTIGEETGLKKLVAYLHAVTMNGSSIQIQNKETWTNGKDKFSLNHKLHYWSVCHTKVAEGTVVIWSIFMIHEHFDMVLFVILVLSPSPPFTFDMRVSKLFVFWTIPAIELFQNYISYNAALLWQ